MKVLIVEDEKLTAREIEGMIAELAPDFNILKVIGTVEEMVDFYRMNQQEIDLIFMDIQLSDGTSFDIFSEVEIGCPVIFITAYNEYVLKAFKLNSVDYLLKPLKKEELRASITKFRKVHLEPFLKDIYQNRLMDSLSRIMNENYVSRLIVSRKGSLIPLNVEEIAFFHSTYKVVKVYARLNEIFSTGKNLEQLEEMLSPKLFFRVNRQFIISIHGIKEVKKHFKRRLQIIPACKANMEIVVSTRKSGHFLEWLNNIEYC